VYYTKCLTEGHSCLVAFDYGSENNVVSQRLVEKTPVTSNLSSGSKVDQIQYMTMCERSIR